MKTRIIALLTDFGLIDPFAGMMKGVMLGLLPNAQLIDISHEIPPGDILRAAVTLWQSTPSFPKGTVFLAVVDPGVGSDRRPTILRSGGHTFVGPDNGLFSLVAKRPYIAFEISNHQWGDYEVSDTFHGRDIFAPAAALASAGEPPSNFGPEITELVNLPLPLLVENLPKEIEGEILYADHFGNLLTSLGKFSYQKKILHFDPWIGGPKLPTNLSGTPRLVLPDGSELPLVRTFSDLTAAECGGIVGSSGLIEIAANRSSAAEHLGLTRGDQIKLITITE